MQQLCLQARRNVKSRVTLLRLRGDYHTQEAHKIIDRTHPNKKFEEIRSKNMVWSEEEIAAFKARRSQGEGSLGKVDDYVNGAQSKFDSPRRSATSSPRKWKPTPTSENKRTDDWLGASPTKVTRSWKVKSTKPVVPNLDL